MGFGWSGSILLCGDNCSLVRKCPFYWSGEHVELIAPKKYCLRATCSLFQYPQLMCLPPQTFVWILCYWWNISFHSQGRVGAVTPPDKETREERIGKKKVLPTFCPHSLMLMKRPQRKSGHCTPRRSQIIPALPTYHQSELCGFRQTSAF